MTRQSTATCPVYSASNALEALGKALGEIKAQDGLTWADMGAVLGVSDDQAAKYASGEAAMNAVAYGRGKREWNGRFTGYFDRLCTDSRTRTTDDRCTLTAMIDLAARLAKALEDGELQPHEIRDNRAQLENVRDLIDAQLAKLRPAA